MSTHGYSRNSMDLAQLFPLDCNERRRSDILYESDGGYDSDVAIDWRTNTVGQGLKNFKLYRNLKQMNWTYGSEQHSRKSSINELEDPHINFRQKCNDTIKEEETFMLDASIIECDNQN